VIQIFESIKMALAALVANKMRAALTTLGVVIGITFVLLMGWILSGLDNALEQTLAIFGDDILYVDKMDWTGQGNWNQFRNRKNITFDQFKRVKERLRSAEYVVPTAREMGTTVRYGQIELTSTLLFGTTADYIGMLGGGVAEGRFFNESEENSGSLVAVIGSNVAESLFPHGDPIGKTIKIEGLPFTVVGTMPKRGTLMAGFVDNQIFMPLKRFFGMFGSRQRVVINVKAGGVDKIDEVRYETIGVMRQVRSLAPGTPDDFSVNTQEQFREQFKQLRTIVWGVGLLMTGLSFLVGSIGIMNIMFVSVTERTKEIGIRKAVGATRRSIMIQFLVEAIALCLFGAAIGLGITSAVASFGSSFIASKWEVNVLSSTIPLSQVGLAVLVSVVVGVLAGVIPAFRAARLDPVDALRAE